MKATLVTMCQLLDKLSCRVTIYAKNLKGIAIGNGWVDPYIQYKAYAQYMYKQGFINSTTNDIDV